MTDLTSLNPRHRELISLVELHGHASIEFLAQRLNCSAQTVRRDIRKLCEASVLQRFRGGASIDTSQVRLGHASKQDSQQVEKGRIAAAALGVLEDGQALFLDTGTTCDHVARALAHFRGKLHVITHNLTAALALGPHHQRFDLQVVGGRVAGSDGALTGPRAIRELSGYRADVAFIAVSGLDADGYVLDFDSEKIEIKQAMMRGAQRSVLLMGSSKLGTRGIRRVAHLDEFDQILCDVPAPEEIQTIMAKPQCWKAVP
ncbi:DeoR/GlpR family DNA-binding transcription regulator [Halomonas sp. GD1P12]|uniref:DeoR/GlpR family DNA-binding transcription regulator n=1 Tax=Halomonas sp. GD1P12 TaxID=2982691 RepID=UPI0021E389B6|nr:DeoR/GlpR family DNA-binding transcription regulator [Halomonas sp. GD1P12]UYG00632.1 DeoR/GlpR family DNA-binding transcription regulator [Halomonas sp. GD1P12]